MVIRFSSVILKNFCSYNDAEICLENKGFCLVSGRNKFKKDNALSNGSGKSTIWSAICFALTGETIGGIKSNLKNINTNSNDCFVTLNFSADTDKYKVTRFYAPKSDLKIIKNDVDISGKGIRESEKILAENLPDLTKDLISTTIILGQGMPNKFSSFSPSGRKDLLEKLTKSDFMADDIKVRINNRQAELQRQIRSCEDTLLVNNTQLKTVVENLDKYKKDKDTYIEKDYDTLILEVTKSISNIQSKINFTTSSIKDLEQLVESQNTTLIAKTAEKAEESSSEFSGYNIAYNEAINNKNICQTKLNYILAEIKKLKNIKDVCPTCGQKIPGVLKPDTSEKELEAKVIEDEIIKLDNRIQVICDAHKKYVDEINNKYINLDTLQVSIKENKTNISNLNTTLTSYNTNLYSEIEKKNKLEYDKENNIRLRKSIDDKISEYNAEYNRLDNEIRLTSLTKLDLDSHASVLRKIETLVKRDFRGYLLYNIIEYLNTKAKEYSKIVFDTDELNIYLDGNSLDISYCGKLYESLSGGEKQRVDIITQFAIRDLLQTYFGYSSNILVLDEITDNLDKLATDKIFDLITDQLKDVESIFIISHHDDELSIPMDTELQVIKDENSISSVKELN